jgi:hypothetical protein
MENLEKHAVRTTAGETFSGRESALLAVLIYRRFGRDKDAAAAAWRRLHENVCPDRNFMILVQAGLEIEAAGREAVLAAVRQIATANLPCSHCEFPEGHET